MHRAHNSTSNLTTFAHKTVIALTLIATANCQSSEWFPSRSFAACNSEDPKSPNDQRLGPAPQRLELGASFWSTSSQSNSLNKKTQEKFNWRDRHEMKQMEKSYPSGYLAPSPFKHWGNIRVLHSWCQFFCTYRSITILVLGSLNHPVGSLLCSDMSFEFISIT